MKRSIIAVLIVTQLIAGCGSAQETASTTTTTRPELPERPELAVDRMVAALMLNDVEALRDLTSDRQLAIIVALRPTGPWPKTARMPPPAIFIRRSAP